MSATVPVTARLLAVDDNADSAELIARVAAKSGYEAKTLADLHRLPRTLQEWKPQVMTLDLCMPEEDGIEVLSKLKAHGFSGAILIVSGQDDRFRGAARRLAMARGINVVADLSKPVDIRILGDVLSKLLGANRRASPHVEDGPQRNAPP